MMKERFAKLLLGEDMSGGGKGVCTALAISNAITNLSGWSHRFLCICYVIFVSRCFYIYVWNFGLLNSKSCLEWQRLCLVSYGG